MPRTSSLRDVVILLLVCFLVFWWRLGKLGLIDPDEPFYAETAREMVATGDWITPQIFGRPQFEKPIFFYWLTAASFKVFGETEFAARVPSALPATVLVGLVYVFGCGFAGRRAAFLAALVLATGLEFAIMSRLMLTDIALALFVAGAMFCYWRTQEDPARRSVWLILHFICGGLALLTKGPIGSLVTLLAVAAYSWLARRRLAYRGPAFWGGLALYALIGVPWYAVMLWKFGREYFDAFFIHENVMRVIQAEHPANNHWYYYIAILALGSIPWMPALALAVNRARCHFRSDPRLAFLWCWILSSLAFLTIVQSKLPSYIFYVFVPLALAVGMALDDLLANGFRTRLDRNLALGLAIFQCIVALAAPLINVARPFAGPALAVGACFVFIVVMLWRQRWWGAIASSAAATVALIGGALLFSVDHVEEYSSARPVALAMMSGQDGKEPLMAGKFLARGIHYYSHQPVFVLANKAQPFWTPHPLPVIAGRDALTEFVQEHGAVRATIRRSEWSFWQKSPLVDAAGEPQWFGDNAVIRLVAPP
jgi:4-amino-4-deoxy-L-arabinose transferase-like glycosyltransferase